MKKIAKETQEAGVQSKDPVKKRQSHHGVHKRGSCSLCQDFNNKRNDKVKNHVKKAHPDKY